MEQDVTIVASRTDGAGLELYSCGSGPGVVVMHGGGTDCFIAGFDDLIEGATRPQAEPHFHNFPPIVAQINWSTG